MGIVKKQAYKNTAVSYAGMVVAYVNTILLFPFFTKNEEYGLYNLLIGLSVLYSLVASLKKNITALSIGRLFFRL
jgi:hypothetical protein